MTFYNESYKVDMKIFLMRWLESLFQSSAKVVKKTSLDQASLLLLGPRSNDKALEVELKKTKVSWHELPLLKGDTVA